MIYEKQINEIALRERRHGLSFKSCFVNNNQGNNKWANVYSRFDLFEENLLYIVRSFHHFCVKIIETIQICVCFVAANLFFFFFLSFLKINYIEYN